MNFADLTFEFYNRITKDLIYDLPVSKITGFSSTRTNIGSMRNRGVELTVSTNNINKKDFSWRTQFNISHNKNVILALDGTDSDQFPSTSSMIQRIGLPYYQYFVIEFSHINPDNGRAMFFMNNVLEDGTINREVTDDPTKAERVAYKSPFPKAILGLSNNFRYKFVDLSFTLSSTLGGYSYDRAADKTQTSGGGDGLVNQLPIYYRDSWKQPGDIVEYEAWIPGGSTVMSTYHNSRRIHSTNHVRLKNLTVGVTLPRHLATKLQVEQVRLYFTGHNLLTIAAHKDYDPEVPTDGWMWYNTPPLKSFSIGININF
jgi:hypothetical protein